MNSRHDFLILALVQIVLGASMACTLSANENQEDQLLAEAIWNFVTDGGYTEKVDDSIKRLRTQFPKSSDAALWEGILRQKSGNQSQFFGKFVESAAQVAARFPELDNLSIGQLRDRLEELSQSDVSSSPASADIAFLQSVELDPRNFVGWSHLVASENKTIAFFAAQQWARADEDNALPLYVQAMIFENRLSGDDFTAQSKTEAWAACLASLREGNKRPKCVFPEPQFPKDFRIVIPHDSELALEFPETSRKFISPGFLEWCFTNRFESFDFLDSSPLAASGFRHLHSRTCRRIWHLSEQEQADVLNEMVLLRFQFLRSNSWNHVLEMLPESSMSRLTQIAMNQTDWQAVDEYAESFSWMRRFSRELSQIYLDRLKPSGKDWVRAIAEGNVVDFMPREIPLKTKGELPTLPQINFTKDVSSTYCGGFTFEDPHTLEATENLHAEGVDLIRFDVFGTRGKFNAVVSRTAEIELPKTRVPEQIQISPDGKYPIEDLSTSHFELISREDSGFGVAPLRDHVRLLRMLNRKRQKNVGPYIVARTQFVASDLEQELEDSGYWSVRDRCVIASPDLAWLHTLRNIRVRLAWIVPSSTVLETTREDVRLKLASAAKCCDAIALNLEEKEMSVEQISELRSVTDALGLQLHLIVNQANPLSKALELASIVITNQCKESH